MFYHTKMDHLIEYTVYSKVIAEISPKIPPQLFIVLAIAFFIYKHLPTNFSILRLYDNADESSIIIPFHTRTYMCGMSKVSKTIYSQRFLAINLYMKSHSKNIRSFVEVMNSESMSYFDEHKGEYILLPSQNQKFLLCPKEEIYLETIVSHTPEENHKEKDKVETTKHYTYKLSKKGKKNLSILTRFLEECVKTHVEEIDKDKTQMIYEFDGSKKDEDNELSLSFKASPFRSNKTFSNIFFENKSQVVRDIREFAKTNEERDKIETQYRYYGIPFKRIYLLHGPPGCGKSSLIKAFINETGRHCILVQWSRIKTSADFANLCSDIKIQYKNIKQSDVILVFEDFDANKSGAVKVRENLKQQNPIKDSLETLLKDSSNTTITKESIETVIKDSFMGCKMEKDDELTLECVLNTLDGIKELYDAVIVFTTNDLVSIDPALIRPGRVDKIIQMDLIRGPIIKDMLAHFFMTNSHEALEEVIKMNSPMAPAKVQEICIQHRGDIVGCVAELLGQ